MRAEIEHVDYYIKRWRGLARGVGVKRGQVPRSELWLVDGDTYIGTVQLRHHLNRRLQSTGAGHIYLDVRPSRRRRGYGTLMLKLALKKARKLGLRTVVVSHSDDNRGSRKIILANGGVLRRRIRRAHGRHDALVYGIEVGSHTD